MRVVEPSERGERVSVGTNIFGAPTLKEVRELIRAKDAQLAAMQAAWATIANAWLLRDDAGEVDWVNDFTALQTRYKAAKDLQSARSLGLPAEALWNRILTALRQHWDPATQTSTEAKGDLGELDRRLKEAGAIVDYSKVPQPTVPDQQLNLFKAADVAVRVIEGGSHDWLVPALVIYAMMKGGDLKKMLKF